jgi:ABC-type Co2+ transport system permease subunit
MGDPIWYIFVGLASVGIAWAIKKIQPVILQIFIAVIISAVLSVLLAFVPELLRPSPPGEAAFGWTVILAATWAMVAIPTCLIAVVVFNRLQRRSQRIVKKQV